MFALRYDEQFRSGLQAIHPIRPSPQHRQAHLHRPARLTMDTAAAISRPEAKRLIAGATLMSPSTAVSTAAFTLMAAPKEKPASHNGSDTCLVRIHSIAASASSSSPMPSSYSPSLCSVPPEVEAESLVSGAHESTRQGVRDLVMHGPAVLRMRVANHGAAPLAHPSPGRSIIRLEPTSRAADKQSFGHGMLAHCEYRGG